MSSFIDPGYFKAMQIPLLEGRSFTAEERLDRANKVIISQELAREVFKGEDPIGKHLAASIYAPEPTTFEIIGVAGDTRELPATDPYPAFYFPLFSGAENSIFLAVRTAWEIRRRWPSR